MLVVGFGRFEVNMNNEQTEHGEQLNKVNNILDPQKVCVFLILSFYYNSSSYIK